MRQSAKSKARIQLPLAHNWRTTDADEVNKRRLRARKESFAISNATPEHPIFSNFRVKSSSGQTYMVEIRDLQSRHSTCDCVDFRTNGLGLCKHTEAVLLFLQGRQKKLFKAAELAGSNRIEIGVDNEAETLRLTNGGGKLPRALGKWFDDHGLMLDFAPETALPELRLRNDGFPRIRLAREIDLWRENQAVPHKLEFPREPFATSTAFFI
jgi:hypothetical protein